MKHIPYPVNFIYPENITEKTYTFGGGQIDDPVLREDGDWRDFVPEQEDQNKFGVESSACYIEAQQHSIASLQEELFALNFNYAARFNALLSNGTQGGGNPIDGAESMRKDGIIPESMMPFDESIKSWDDYHSWKGAHEAACIAAGKAFLDKWELKYHVVSQRGDSTEAKYAKMQLALKRGPVPMSVYAWVEIDGLYVKPDGSNDTHLTMAVYLDEKGVIWVWDTYSPYLKQLAPNTNFEFSMQWSIRRKQQTTKLGFWAMVIDIIKKLWQ